ncbi:unnamed protein product [Somion occarium]|uniref:Ubinuclein middle domain-containing protein n=1 Tax=Somion occarium TaxID=3059160 RepID=A0ABP1CS46_9APHY
MASDVEMVIQQPEVIVVDDSRPPSPPHQSPIPVDDDASPAPSAQPSASPSLDNSASYSTDSLQVINDDRIAPAKDKKKIKPTTLKPASTVGAKPKPKARSPSPSPPPPPIRPPLQTIRLDIKLGGPENYEVDVASLSKQSGQRPATPVPIKPDTSDESHSEGDDEGDGKPKEKKRKRKNVASEYYDVTDPFIDDSELAQEERTFFAQTKQQGFYVSSGQVQLLDVKPPTPKKPKSKKINILKPSASVATALSSASLPPSLAPLSLNGAPPSRAGPAKPPSSVMTKMEGTSSSPIPVQEVDELKPGSSSGVKRKFEIEGPEPSPSITSVNGTSKKKRKMVEIRPFHPEIEAGIEQLREAIAKENWEVKGKFPQSLKPLLAQVALRAVIMNEYDDNFFNVMPKIFPYNKYTMTKLIKRTIWKEHVSLLQQRQNAMLEELRVMAEEGFPKAKEEWEKSVVAWEKRQEKAKAEVAGAHPPPSTEGTPAPSAQVTPTLAGAALPAREDGGNDTGMEHDHEDAGQGPSTGGGKGVTKDSHPPAKRYKLTDRMKERIWDLVCLSNEMCRIENEKNILEGSNAVVSDQGARKVLYQKIVSVFPDGWLTTGQISRDVSVIKKKSEKETDE